MEAKKIHHGPYPELTWTAVVLGWVIGSLITVAIGYTSLKLGFSIEGSELAAILGWGVLRGVLGRTSIVENNINQTLASAVNGASAGMMFSVPALFILNKSYPGAIDFDPTLLVLSCIAGGIVGLCFVIPLRKQMIDFNRLAYPGGIATAAILKSPGAGAQKALVLLVGALVSGGAHVVALQAGVEDWPLGERMGWPAFLNVTFYLSVMTIGVGFLSGRGGLWFGAGGFLCYFLLSPLLARFGDPAVAELARGASAPGDLRGLLFRPTGIGILIGAAIGSIVFAAPLIRSAIRSMHDAGKEQGAAQGDEMPIRFLYGGVALGGLALVALTWSSVGEVGFGRAAAMAALGVLWIWIAGVIVSECVGRTNWNPVSGMTLIAVTILLLVAGYGGGPQGTPRIVSSVFMGAAICVAIAQASDMMLDLKSGYLVGASPRKQQIAQMLGTWLGPILIMVLIFVLQKAGGPEGGFGSEKLPAAQAMALSSVIEGIVGGNIPEYRYFAGAGLGLLVALSGLGGIGVLLGLGFYMPFNIVLTYTIGNGLRIAADRFAGRHWVEQTGIPLAAGLIVGEALVGVGHAVLMIFSPGGGA